MGQGETVLFAGTRLTSRETGVLAAIGRASVPVFRRPRVAILSTGDEIAQPGEAMRPGLVYDSNGRILSDAVTELGGEPVFLGAFRDDVDALRAALSRALESLPHSQVEPADPDATPLPFGCPAYPQGALNELGLEDLYGYLASLAPPKSKWKIR